MNRIPRIHIIACGVMELDFAAIGTRQGVELTYEEFEMGYEIRPVALRRVGRWMRGVMAVSRRSGSAT